MANEEGKSEIGKLEEKLYSRTRYSDPEDKRRVVDSLDVGDVQESWQSPDLDEMLKSDRIYTRNSHPIMKKLFISSLVFFVLAVVVAGYMFFGGTRFVSSKNVDISVIGPANVSAGDALELGVTVSNNNNADLETVTLSVQYPEGTRSVEDTTKTLTFTKEDLGSIRAGGEAVRNLKASLFGATGDIKEITLSVEYRIKDSSATFYKEKVYEIVIGDSPLSLAVEGARLVDSGEEFVTTLTATLNSEEPMKGVMIRAEYPYGYSVTSSSPTAVSDNNVWFLGDMAPGEKKTVTIRGRLSGEHQEERTFRFYLGVSDNGLSASNFKTVITAMQSTVAIARSAVGLTIILGGESNDNFVAPAGSSISSAIRFQNNLPEKILNPKIEMFITGSALNKSSVLPSNNGVYDSGNNKVTWALIGRSGASELNPGESDRVSFNFASMSDLPQFTSNREIKIEVVFTGTPLGSGGRQVVTRESRTVKISSQVSLSTTALRSSGPFVSSGPIPPKAEEETTYTILWSAGNTMSDAENVSVTAKLGSNVRWVESNDGSVSYNENSNTVTWDIGNLPSGTGFTLPSKQVYFQVVLVPSVIQIGTAPILLNNISLSGRDTHTNSTVNTTNPSLTTRLLGDPTFVQGDDIVVQ